MGTPGSIERQNETLIAELDTDIVSMDNVETTNGRLKIGFIDDTKVSLTEHTVIEINEYETKLAINWILLNANNNIIGNIEQEKIITNNLIKSLWPQLSKKIIEMALNDIVYLINLEK